MIATILNRPNWKSRIIDALHEQDDRLFWCAREAADLLNIDTWEYHFQRVRDGKPDWFYVMETKDKERMWRALEYAEQTMPLDEITTGPANEMGLGGSFVAHNNLEWILQALSNWPGSGLKFIHAGLRNPVIRNRDMALMALKTWGREHRIDNIEQDIISLQQEEPNAKTLGLIAELLAN